MLELAWYCPSEGDGRHLGTRAAERAPTFEYLLDVVRTAERAGAAEILVPTGAINDSFAPNAPFAESWTTAAALAARTDRIRLIVALNPAGISAALAAHQAETLAAIAPGRIAINLVAGGGPDDGYGHAPLPHDARYARLGELADALRARFPGPLYLGGASDAARALAARAVDTYLMWGEEPGRIAERIDAMRALAGRPMRFGLRIHIIARPTDDEARAAAGELLSLARVQDDRAGEYAGFDSVGQERMNAIAADATGWVAPGLWAGIREVRGGAGTALVGDYDHVAAWLRRYRDAGVDMVIASGYPHREEVERVAREVWPRITRRRNVTPGAPAPQPPRNARDLAERFGTPLYVFDGARLESEAAAFRDAWGPDTTVAYSMKSNPLMGIVTRLHRAGMWAEVASGFEYRTARRGGVPGSQIVFNGPHKTIDDLRRAMREGATIVADGPEEVRRIASLAAEAVAATRIGIRLSPPGRERTDRFGMTPRHAAAAEGILARAGLRLTGLHTHLGAYQLGPLPPTGPPIHSVTVEYPVPVGRFAAAAANLVAAADGIGGIEWLDLGGGWPAAAGLAEYVAAVRGVVDPDRFAVILEPGRALVRDAGWLLVRVVARRGRGAVVVDAGITQVPCVLWKRSPVHVVEPRPGQVRATSLFGPLCLQHDAIARDVELPPLRVGDLAWIGQTGAYAMAQASPFIHLRPAAIMVEGGRATLLRERETDDEALGAQAEPLLVGRDGRVMPA